MALKFIKEISKINFFCSCVFKLEYCLVRRVEKLIIFNYTWVRILCMLNVSYLGTPMYLMYKSYEYRKIHWQLTKLAAVKQYVASRLFFKWNPLRVGSWPRRAWFIIGSTEVVVPYTYIQVYFPLIWEDFRFYLKWKKKKKPITTITKTFRRHRRASIFKRR